MQRSTFGINLDQGVALTSPIEFDQLFVDAESEAKIKLLEWLQTGEQPALFGGQIGSGKTTLIEYAFFKSKIQPDMIFHFDRDTLNISPSDSWSIVFIEVFQYLAEKDLVNKEEIPSEYIELLGGSSEAWQHSLSQIRLHSFSKEALEKRKAFGLLMESTQSYLSKFLDLLIGKINSIKSEPLFLFASGVDKFEPGSSGYYALRDVLEALTSYKTLFEVNAVHLFSAEPWMRKIDRIVISPLDAAQVGKILEKRLGVYAKNYVLEIPLIAKYSGGIARQALRLLDSFLSIQKKSDNNIQAFQKAIKNVNRDLFAFSQRPETALMQNVYKNQFLETDLISIPGDKETAKRAVFGNWVVLAEHLHESRWRAYVNPLIRFSFISGREPEDADTLLLKKYAQQTGTSGYGLDLDVQQVGWRETLLNELENPIELNVTQVLDSISSALLSTQRADRIIVGFKDSTVANVVRAYFEAKSNTYEYQSWKHYILEDDGESTPLIDILKSFDDEFIDVYSYEFSGDFSQSSIEELDMHRDSFIDKQMIWWIPQRNLKKYLERWTQLRQFFQIFILEEDLRKSLSMSEIQSDIDFMAELAESEKTAPFVYVENLKIVLNYLKGIAHE